MQVGIPACKPEGSHAIKPVSIHKGQQVLSQSSSTNKKYFSKRKQKNEKRKRKLSQRTGFRQAKRNRNKSRRVS